VHVSSAGISIRDAVSNLVREEDGYFEFPQFRQVNASTAP